jgi:hypothetical protein
VHREGQRRGRFDNRDLYGALYVAATPAGAIGERFASLSRWSRSMLATGVPAGGEYRLATLYLDEDAHPLVDFNDTNELEARKLRPRDVVERNWPKTQRIARDVFNEPHDWSGITWWSTHRANWTLHVLWIHDDVTVDRVEELPGHPGLLDAAGRLAKELDDDLRR